MKFKYKLKFFEKKQNNKKILNCNFFTNKEKIKLYIFKNKIINKILKNNFLIIEYFNKKYYTFIKNVKITYINNNIESFDLYEIGNFIPIKVYSNFLKTKEKILLKNINKFPRNVKLNLTYKKKRIKDLDFNFKNFKFENKILFYYKKNMVI